MPGIHMFCVTNKMLQYLYNYYVVLAQNCDSSSCCMPIASQSLTVSSESIVPSFNHKTARTKLYHILLVMHRNSKAGKCIYFVQTSVSCYPPISLLLLMLPSLYSFPPLPYSSSLPTCYMHPQILSSHLRHCW